MGELSVMLTLSLLYGNILDPKTGKDQPGHHWSYEGNTGPAHWKNQYPRCAGHRQSPVNIRSGEVEYASWLTEFQFIDYDKYLGHGLRKPITAKNNGHTASMAVTENLVLRGAHLNGDYQLAEMHLHWGSNGSIGSEHCLDQKRRPAEVHFVHYARRYGNLSEAMKMPDGLAVIGVFVELVPDDTFAFDSLANGIDSILEYGRQTNISNIRISDFLPRNRRDFYHYRGSLTTPPCYESVLWFVMMDTIYISQRQLDRFRYLQEKVQEHVAATGRANSVSSRVVQAYPEFIRDNYRPTQPLYGRKIYCSTMMKPQLRNFELPAVKRSPIRKPAKPVYQPPSQFNSVPNRVNHQPHKHYSPVNYSPPQHYNTAPKKQQKDYIFRSGISGNYPGSNGFTGVISNGNSMLIGNIAPQNIKGAVYPHLTPDFKYSAPIKPVNPINMGTSNDHMRVFKNPDTNGINSAKPGPLLDYIFTQVNGLTRGNSQDSSRRYQSNDYPGLPKDRIYGGLSHSQANHASSRVLSNPFQGNYNKNNVFISNSNYQANHNVNQNLNFNYGNHGNAIPSSVSYPGYPHGSIDSLRIMVKTFKEHFKALTENKNLFDIAPETIEMFDCFGQKCDLVEYVMYNFFLQFPNR